MTQPASQRALHRVAGMMPITQWSRTYSASMLSNDMLAALIVTIMLVPQSLAYALLAGLPPEMGLYASVLPLVAYAIFGTSRTLAVGPVAIVSLMTAAAVGNLNLPGPAEYALAAITLAFMSGLILLAMGVFRLGFLANFLSHPVVAGFITASGILIAASQLRHIFGISGHGHTLPELLSSMWAHAGELNLFTLAIGVGSVALLVWSRTRLQGVLTGFGMGPKLAAGLTKAGPVLAVVLATLVTWGFGLQDRGVSIVGDIPRGLPPLTVPSFDWSIWRDLAVAALLISIIGFVESVSVAQTLAAKRRQRIEPDQELIGLGASNVAAALSGGYPVTGGFARSVVNFDAGAETPAAGIFTAVGIGLVALFLTPLLFFLPKATLAATILVAVLTLVDFSILKRTFDYSKADFSAVAATIVVTLLFGVELGVSAGVLLSIALFLLHTSRPHVAEVGEVPGTTHYRNINRHKVRTYPEIVSLRVDENLYFANARYLEDVVLARVVGDENVRHVVLMFSAVNDVDASALESLEAINHRLKDMDIRLHLSEVKGPVMDKLGKTHLIADLGGQVFLSHHGAIAALTCDGAGAPTAVPA